MLRRDGPPPLPRLHTTASATDRPRTAWVVTPDWDKPSGGVRKLYRTVDVLNAAGVSAAVMHQRPGFRCTWFDHATRIVDARTQVVEPGDVITVPEIHGPSLAGLPRGVGRVILNQNIYVTVDSLTSHGAPAAAPYAPDPDLLAIGVVSEHNREVAEYLFPGVAVRRVRWALDGDLYHPPTAPPGRRVAVMPRRRPDQVAQVLALLQHRNALAGWEVVRIDGRSEIDVAAALRSCPVFLSFSEREGLGLPPLEALASGCQVVGFDGFAGREFFAPPQAHRVEDGDVVAFCRAAEQVLRDVAADPQAAWQQGVAESRRVLDAYSAELERADLLRLFAALMH